MGITQRRVAYLAERISPNLAKTPEGYLLARNVVIARSGLQTYRERELFQDGSDHVEVKVFRHPDAVSDPAFIASLSGKSLTEQHPSAFLTAHSDGWHARGTVLNPHELRLEKGGVVIVADLLIKDSGLIEKVLQGHCREISVGYTYTLDATEDGVLQVRDLRANHVALVDHARANADRGDLYPRAEIRDAAGGRMGLNDFRLDEATSILNRITKQLRSLLEPDTRTATDSLHRDGSARSWDELQQRHNPLAKDDDSDAYATSMRVFLGKPVTAGLAAYSQQSHDNKRTLCRPSLLRFADSAQRDDSDLAAERFEQTYRAEFARRQAGGK